MSELIRLASIAGARPRPAALAAMHVACHAADAPAEGPGHRACAGARARHVRPWYIPRGVVDRNGTPAASRPRGNPVSRLAVVAFSLSAAGLHLDARAQTVVAATLPTTNVEIIGVTPIDSTGVPLSQFPANAQRLGGKDARAQGSTNVADLLNANLGSATVSDGTGNPYQNDINYRGFQASSLLGAPVGLSVYFDGIRMNEPFGSVVNWDLIPMNAMSSIDILPGSNPIFGMNTLGGALVVNTRNGKDDPGTALQAVGGSFGRFGVNAESGWADDVHGTDYFLSANDDHQTGFRTHSASRVKQAYAKARWNADGGRTMLSLAGSFADTALHGTQALPLDMMSDTRAAYTWPDSTSNRVALLSLSGTHALDDTHELDGNVHYRHARSAGLNSNASLDDGCFNDDGSPATTVVDGATVAQCANKAPDGTAVNAVTGANALALGYGRWTNAINTSLVESVIRTDTIGGSAQWSSSDRLLDHGNTLTLGGSIDHSRMAFDQSAYLARLIGYQTVVIPNQEYGFTADGQAPAGGNLPAFTGGNVLSGVTLSSSTTDLSLYFTDTLQVTRRFSATVSGSYADSRLRQDGANNQYLNDDGGWNWTDDVSGVSYYNPDYVGAWKYSNTGTGAATTPLAPPAGAVAGPESNSLYGVHHFHRFNPALGVNYNFDDGQGVFASYSESMRAPTSIELSCADPNNPCALPTGFNGDPDLKAVVARTLEFGGRGTIVDGVRWNAATYDSRLRDDIQFIATSSSYGYFANVGETERRGFELGAQATLKQLFLSASYAYVRAVYRSAFTTAGGQDVVSGDRIPGIPAHSFKLRASVDIDPRVSVGGNLIAVGRQFAHGNESNSDPTAVVAAYTLVNLDLHLKLTPALELSAYVNNLFDRRYSTYGLSGTPSIYTLVTQQFNTPAPPRAVWASLTYSFGGKAAPHQGD